MLDLSQPMRLYEGVSRRRQRDDIFVCEWNSFVHAKPPQKGVFLVIAGHFNEARQTARKILRDEIAMCLLFNFKLRGADPAELAQIASAPTGSIVRVPRRAGALAPAPTAETFSGASPADSTSKT